MPPTRRVASLLLLLAPRPARAFVSPPRVVPPASSSPPASRAAPLRPLLSAPEDRNGPDLGQKFGGYTAKQRLREEVESPFRTVRLAFFASSTGSALTALYFSILSAVKASAPAGTYVDQMSVDDALTNCGINVGAAVVCGALTYRDWKAGQANLERIAQGGRLASLTVSPASESDGARVSLKEYRRRARVVIAAGGRGYVEELCRSLNADQLSDSNTLPRALEEVDVVVVPVLLESGGEAVGDSRSVWRSTKAKEGDRNFDSTRSDGVVAFPRGNAAWAEYLRGEVETAMGQGFDVVDGGITITVKKNGRILRRATGLPQWGGLVGAMEVMDGRFGMPGDSEKYETVETK